VIASAGPHFGEETPISGRSGSGTIFFSGCNLQCAFCQNHDISHGRAGRDLEAAELAAIMLNLQAAGCHNLNLVTPSHVVPQILAALLIATDEGLTLPLVYNSGGYDSLETLRQLDGIVDIYMPDLKYASGEIAGEFSGAPDYPEVARSALREMHRQVGDLETDPAGVARRGLLVRHLVLPDGAAGTTESMRFLAEELSPATAVNVMAQYRPLFRAGEHPAIDRRPTPQEHEEACKAARRAGLHRFY
jgi:putative pyruvate formate lyase activating enzyme